MSTLSIKSVFWLAAYLIEKSSCLPHRSSRDHIHMNVWRQSCIYFMVLSPFGPYLSTIKAIVYILLSRLLLNKVFSEMTVGKIDVVNIVSSLFHVIYFHIRFPSL